MATSFLTQKPVKAKAAFGVNSPEVQAFLDAIRNENLYNLQTTVTRNVIFVGRTRSGKSTAVGVVKDPCFTPKKMSIFSDTVDAKFETFTIALPREREVMRQQHEALLSDPEQIIAKKIRESPADRYSFNIIDTPGLFEERSDGSSRSNTALMKTIAECMKNEITKVNCIVMFCTYTAGIREQDVAALNTFLQLFKGADENAGCLALCFTHSESMPEEDQERILGELREYPKLKEVMKVVGHHVYFMGCAEAGKEENLESFKIKTKTVYAMRMRLINFVLAADTQVSLKSLRFMMETATEVIAKLKKAMELGNRLLRANQTLGDTQLFWSEYKEIQRQIVEEWKHLLTFEDIEPVWFQYYHFLVQSQKDTNNDPEVVRELVGTVRV